MKYIQKQPQPHSLVAWTHAKRTDDEGNEQQWSYDDMPSDVRLATKESLLHEQGGLCCYTGRRISSKTSHIEHLKPQAKCTGHEDTDYHNLVAAYPSSEWDTPECAYGAHKKGSWYVEELFIHPRRTDCEARFRYRGTGKIEPADPNDIPAVKTIEKLGLNNSELVQMRKRALEAAIYEADLTKAKVQRLLAGMDRRDGQGQFYEFSFVIKQACEKYLKRFAQPKSKH